MDEPPEPKYLLTPKQHRERAAELRRKYPGNEEMVELALAHEQFARAQEIARLKRFPTTTAH